MEHPPCAALHHLRQRRRRQEHPDRPAAVREQEHLRRPAAGAGKRLAPARHPGRTDRLGAAGRWPAGRARTGHHHRRGLPLLRHRPAPFIVADTPGHEQYTRNMATGASTASWRDPGRRAQGPAGPDPPPFRIVAMMGIRHVVLAVNKMDLVGLRPGGIRRHRGRLPELCGRPRLCQHPGHSAVGLEGDNVLHRQPPHAPWYDGPTLMDYLDSVDSPHTRPVGARRRSACRCSG
jgi:hypothetical protein